jgi:uncharacterized protein
MTPVPAVPTDHAGMEVLTRAECDHLLATTPVGRVAFRADGEIQVLPVNYAWVESTIVFRTAAGAKLEAAARRDPFAFEIDGWDPVAQTGWSVLVKGASMEVLDDDALAILTATHLRPWTAAIEKRRWVRIRPDEITGRKIV